MIDLYKHKQTRTAKKIFTILVSVLVVALIFLLIFFRLRQSSINESVWRIGTKGQSVLRVFASYLSSKNKLSIENVDLRNQLEEAQLQILNTSIYKDENKRLKEILGRNEYTGMVLAQILSKPNKSPYDIIIVDVGSVDGIQVGQKVIARGLIPIGEIVEVGKKTSKTKLYSTPGTVTETLLEGSQIDLDLKGAGSGGFEIIIPKDVEVHVGQAILNKQIHSKIIALVSGVVSNEHDSYKKVLAKSPVNIQELSWVQIVTE